MTIRKLQTNFTSGEITPDLLGRTDLPVYNNGAALARNVRPLSGGGLRRRGGLGFCIDVPNDTYQHNEWIFNADQTYQLLFSNAFLRIHDGVTGGLIGIYSAPWDLTMLGRLSVYCQGDYAFVAHPDLPPHQIVRTGASSFVIEPYRYDRTVSGSEAPIWQPYHKYARPDVVIRVSAISGYDPVLGFVPGAQADIQTVEPVLSVLHVGTMFQIGNAQWEIIGYNNTTHLVGVLRSANYRLPLVENPMTVYQGTNIVTVYDPYHDFLAGYTVTLINAVPFMQVAYQQINGPKALTYVDASNWGFSSNLTGTDPPALTTSSGGGPNVEYWSQFTQTVAWKEQMYSAVRGWPHCVGGYQSRLIFGGGRSSPNRLNFSRLEAPFNFDVGSGLDDDAISVGVSGRRTPTIQSVIGAEHVQIFTSEGEYFIPRGEDTAALTPTTIAVIPQTFYGSLPGITPVEFDGATLFVSRNGSHLRQLVWGEKGYSAPDLSFVAHHLMDFPKWLAVQMEDPDQAAATALIVRTDGQIASLTMMRSEKIVAWSMHSTDGVFQTACAVDNRAFFLVQRVINGTPVMWLEKLEQHRLLDGSSFGVYVGPSGQDHVWSNFDRFIGMEISIVVDGASDIGLHLVDIAGQVSINVPATTVEGGLGFTPYVRTLPPEMGLPDGPTPGQPRRIVCANLRVDRTLAMTVRRTKVLNTKAHLDLGLAAEPITGNVEVFMLGWDDLGQVDVSQNGNGPFNLLSANLDVEF
jgi:hypothetical protein